MQKSQYRLMGVPWATVSEGPQTITSLIKLSAEPTYEVKWELGSMTAIENDLLAHAPQIQFRNASGDYDVYFWVTNGWLDDGSNGGMGADIAGWCNNEGSWADPSNPAVALSNFKGVLLPGVGAWFYDPLDDSVVPTMSGAIQTANITRDCPIDYSIRALTVPQDVNVNDSTKIVFAGVQPYTVKWELGSMTAIENDLLANAPQIQVQRLNSSQYDCYFYVDNAWLDDGSNDGAGADIVGWCNNEGSWAVPTNPAVKLSECKGTIFAGSAMWTRGVKSAFTVEFKGF